MASRACCGAQRCGYTGCCGTKPPLSTSSFISYTDYSPDAATLAIPASPSSVLLADAGTPFYLSCGSNVTIQFAGTLYLAAGTASVNTITVTLQYYNAAAPSVVSIVPVSLQVQLVSTAEVGDIVPFTAVQTASLPAGSYVSLLSLSASSAVSVNIDGMLSILSVRAAA